MANRLPRETPGRLFGSDPLLVDVVALFASLKFGLVVVALLGSQLLPFNWQLYEVNLVWPLRELPDIFRIFNTWDTQHYLLLAKQGYGANAMSNAFYPLYPMLIRMITPLFFNHELIAGWVGANLISFLVPIYMYRLCTLFWTREQAFRACVLLMAFPTAFYLHSAYTEALYLALCLMAFYYLFRADVVKASIVCLLLPLARAQALLFLLPIGVLFLQSALDRQAMPAGGLRYALKTYAPPALATAFGMLAYFAFCYWQLGSPFAGLEAQGLFVANNSLGNIIAVDRWFTRNFVDISLNLHGYTTSIIDRAAFILCAPLLIGIFRTQPKALFAYAFVTMLVPALSDSFMSYTRHLLLVFPMFILIATSWKRGVFSAAPMFALQVLFYLMHTGGYWVA